MNLPYLGNTRGCTLHDHQPLPSDEACWHNGLVPRWNQNHQVVPASCLWIRIPFLPVTVGRNLKDVQFCFWRSNFLFRRKSHDLFSQLSFVSPWWLPGLRTQTPEEMCLEALSNNESSQRAETNSPGSWYHWCCHLVWWSVLQILSSHPGLCSRILLHLLMGTIEKDFWMNFRCL